MTKVTLDAAKPAVEEEPDGEVQPSSRPSGGCVTANLGSFAVPVGRYASEQMNGGSILALPFHC